MELWQTAAVEGLRALQLCSQEKPAFCKDLENLLIKKVTSQDCYV